MGLLAQPFHVIVVLNSGRKDSNASTKQPNFYIEKLYLILKIMIDARASSPPDAVMLIVLLLLSVAWFVAWNAVPPKLFVVYSDRYLHKQGQA